MTKNSPQQQATNPQDIVARLDALESRIAIERLIASYAQAFDRRDAALLRSIWHDDARLSLGAAFGDFSGIEPIMESAKTNWASMPHMHHWMANAIIDLDGERASATVAVDCLCTHVSMGQVQISGLYHDQFERRDGRWAFVEREFDMHFLTPLANWVPVAGIEVVDSLVAS
ncbi:nuclear transport factor 2 family protein [Janthinobacterium sp.]|uniref:nuclear transport factor 2 family protein n=1 Tax=Janthinobacterium sp. TaxID=1871054 RepID=UPI0028A0E6C4|nr:nuclear transport factor 2 family protein [Janthinobacterium sp.]